MHEKVLTFVVLAEQGMKNANFCGHGGAGHEKMLTFEGMVGQGTWTC